MTPEATIAALHLIDRWRQMLAHLAGERPKSLPALPGTRHRAPDRDDDPLADEWDALHAPARLIDADDNALD